jgi:hypothetical protein
VLRGQTNIHCLTTAESRGSCFISCAMSCALLPPSLLYHSSIHPDPSISQPARVIRKPDSRWIAAKHEASARSKLTTV